MASPTRVLILCTGNSARSQMAEGWLRHFGGDAFEVASAGTKPAERVNPLAVRAMAVSQKYYYPYETTKVCAPASAPTNGGARR